MIKGPNIFLLFCSGEITQKCKSDPSLAKNWHGPKMKIPAEYGLCGSSWCDAACLAILISCYSSPWIPHSKQINNSRFSCPRSSTCGLHPLLLFLPRTRLSSLYLLSFLLLCCQLIPTGTLSLKFHLTSSGRLSVILWERSGASGYPVAALSTRKSHLHFQLSSFPSRSSAPWGQRVGFVDLYSPVLSKCHVPTTIC